MSRCDCELLMHYADCPYDGPDYTAARFDALEAEVTALREAGDAMAEAINGYMMGTFNTRPMMAELLAWRALEGPGDRREDHA